MQQLTNFQASVWQAVNTGQKCLVYSLGSDVTALDFQGDAGAQLICNLNLLETLIIERNVTNAFNGLELNICQLILSGTVTSSFNKSILNFEILDTGKNVLTASFLQCKLTGINLTSANAGMETCFKSCVIQVDYISVRVPTLLDAFVNNKFTTYEVTFSVLGVTGDAGGSVLDGSLANNTFAGTCSYQIKAPDSCNLRTESQSFPTSHIEASSNADTVDPSCITSWGTYVNLLNTLTININVNGSINPVLVTEGSLNNNIIRSVTTSINALGAGYNGASFQHTKVVGNSFSYANPGDNPNINFDNSSLNLLKSISITGAGMGCITSGSFFNSSSLSSCSIEITGVFTNLFTSAHIEATGFSFLNEFGHYSGVSGTFLTQSHCKIGEMTIEFNFIPQDTPSYFNSGNFCIDKLRFLNDISLLFSEINLFPLASLDVKELTFEKGLAVPTIWSDARIVADKILSKGNLVSAFNGVNLEANSLLVRGDLNSSFSDSVALIKKIRATSITDSFTDSLIKADSIKVQNNFAASTNTSFFVCALNFGSYTSGETGPTGATGTTFYNNLTNLNLNVDIAPVGSEYLDLVKQIRNSSSACTKSERENCTNSESCVVENQCVTLKYLAVNQYTINVLALPQTFNLQILALYGTAKVIDIPDNILKCIDTIKICRQLSPLECMKLETFGLV